MDMQRINEQCIQHCQVWLNEMMALVESGDSIPPLPDEAPMLRLIDAVMEVNTALVYRLQCGRVKGEHIAGIRAKVAGVMSPSLKYVTQAEPSREYARSRR